MAADAIYLIVVALLVFGGVYLALGARRHAPAHGQVLPSLRALSGYTRLLSSLPVVARARERSLTAERRAQALRQLPTMLDVLTLGLSAGLSFDAALELYCTRYDTGLSAALREALLTWRLGAKSRGAALEDLAEVLDIAALRRFSAAVSQALAFGAPLAATLERQAQAIREEQRSELEEEIERVPVKMLVPLGTLIVPAMLLAILGPLLGSSISAA